MHEVLTPVDKENYQENCLDAGENIYLHHWPDKSKSRSNYLPLLELSVKEDPNDDRNLHYLGREYMYYHKYTKAIKTFHKHLKCKNRFGRIKK